MDAPYSSCIKDVSSSSAYDSPYFKQVFLQSSVYSQKLCLKMCYQSILMSNCSCQDPETVLANLSYTTCSFTTQLTCRNSIRNQLFGKTFIPNNCIPYCPKECDTIEYQYIITGATFPSPFYADYLINNPQSSIKSYFNASSSYTDVANSVMVVSGKSADWFFSQPIYKLHESLSWKYTTRTCPTPFTKMHLRWTFFRFCRILEDTSDSSWGLFKALNFNFITLVLSHFHFRYPCWAFWSCLKC